MENVPRPNQVENRDIENLVAGVERNFIAQITPGKTFTLSNPELGTATLTVFLDRHGKVPWRDSEFSDSLYLNCSTDNNKPHSYSISILLNTPEGKAMLESAMTKAKVPTHPRGEVEKKFREKYAPSRMPPIGDEWENAVRL